MQVSFKKWKHLHFVQVGVMNAVLVSDGNIFFLWDHERWHLSPRHDFDPDRANKKGWVILDQTHASCQLCVRLFGSDC